jgi:hypothetical protein
MGHYVEKLARSREALKLVGAGAAGAAATAAGLAGYKSHRRKIEQAGRRKGYQQRVREELMARGAQADRRERTLAGQNEYLRLQLARRLGQIQGQKK